MPDPSDLHFAGDEPELSESKMKMLWSLITNQARSTLMLLPLDDVKALKRSFEISETMGPFLDPTAMRDAYDSGMIDRNRELLKATLAYVEVLDGMKRKEMAARASGSPEQEF